MSKLEIHPEAAGRFNERAERLAGKLSNRPVPPRPRGGLADRLHVPDHVAVDAMTEESRDFTGDQGFLVTTDSAGSLGLYSADYIEMQRLAEAIHRIKDIRDTVSVEFIRDQVFGWVKEHHAGKATLPMTSVLLQAAAAAVTDQEVWIPVEGLFIEAEFEIGNSQIRTMPKSILDATEHHAQNHPTASPEDKKELLSWVEKKRRQLQGHAAVVVQVSAEPDRAIELASEEADTVLAVLRLFAPANYRASETSTCAPVGQILLPERHVFIVNAGRISKEHRRREDMPSQWVISASDAEDFRTMGLTALSELLRRSERSEFQTAALSALLLYTRGALERELSNRLVYQFAGLESLLLADGKEGIVQNLSERMAFALEQTADARAEVISAVKEAYDLRSGFVHHGRPVQDLVAFERFAGHAWKFMMIRLTRSLHFPTKRDFIKALDRVKLS